jgi:hypothetical protein
VCTFIDRQEHGEGDDGAGDEKVTQTVLSKRVAGRQTQARAYLSTTQWLRVWGLGCRV